jgi:hypothetical protein
MFVSGMTEERRCLADAAVMFDSICVTVASV